MKVEVSTEAALTCRLCGSERVRLRGTKVGKFYRTPFSFFSCFDCSYAFVDPVLGPSIYNEAYYKGKGPDPFVDYESEYRDHASTPRLHEFRDFFRIAEAHFSDAWHNDSNKAITWLDFGCGAGGLLKFLRTTSVMKLSGRSVPIQPSGSDVGVYADYLRQKDGFKIWSQEELESLPEESFDVISCIEVVEHVEYPTPLFQLLAKLLRPKGLLLLTTGNLKAPIANLYGLRFPYYLPEIHIGYFNPGLLRRIYTEVGLEPIAVQYDSSLKFKILKNLPKHWPLKMRSLLAEPKPVRRVLDRVFGVSMMPCATKR